MVASLGASGDEFPEISLAAPTPFPLATKPSFWIPPNQKKQKKKVAPAENMLKFCFGLYCLCVWGFYRVGAGFETVQGWPESPENATLGALWGVAGGSPVFPPRPFARRMDCIEIPHPGHRFTTYGVARGRFCPRFGRFCPRFGVF